MESLTMIAPKGVPFARTRAPSKPNRFRKLGFINYDVGDNLHVHSSLLNVVLHDDNGTAETLKAKKPGFSAHRGPEPPAEPGEPLTKSVPGGYSSPASNDARRSLEDFSWRQQISLPNAGSPRSASPRNNGSFQGGVEPSAHWLRTLPLAICLPPPDLFQGAGQTGGKLK